MSQVPSDPQKGFMVIRQLPEKWSENGVVAQEHVDSAKALQEFLLGLGRIVECPQGPTTLLPPKQTVLY